MGTLKTKFGFVAALVAIAFTLPSFAALPDGFQQLEYIQASGQCRIKTGLTPAWDDKVEMTWQPTTVSGNQNLWCSRADGKQQFTAFMIGNTLRYDRNGKQTASAAIFAVGTRYSLEADYGAGVVVVKNDMTGAQLASVSAGETGSYTAGSELVIFASHGKNISDNVTNWGSYRLYTFRLRNSSDTLRLDLVPAKRLSDDALGVYDLVNNAFLTNDQSGSFIAGPAAKSVYTWTGGASGNISAAANWTPAPAGAFTADDELVVETAASITVDAATTVGKLTLNAAAATSFGGSATLTTGTISNRGEGDVTFNCPVQFAGTYYVEKTGSVKFPGGATATYPDNAMHTADSTALARTLEGDFTFTEDWIVSNVGDYPWIVPSGSTVHGENFSGLQTSHHRILRVDAGGYACFTTVTNGWDRGDIDIDGTLEAAEEMIVRTRPTSAADVSHFGRSGNIGTVKAKRIAKAEHAVAQSLIPNLIVGSGGIGSVTQDYLWRFEVDTTITAMDDFDVIAVYRSGNAYDWGIGCNNSIPVTITFNVPEGKTVTYGTGFNGTACTIRKTGAGTLVMTDTFNGNSNHVKQYANGTVIEEGLVRLQANGQLGTGPVSIASGAALEFANPAMATIANATTAADGATIVLNFDGGLLQGRMGALVAPASGVAKIKVLGDPVAGRVYELSSGAQLTAADVAKFAVEGRDDLTLSISPSGNLAFSAEGSSATQGTTFVYAAESAAEAVWSTAVAAWTTEGVTGKTPFAAGGNAVFQGAIDAAAATVTVDEDITVGNVTIDTASDIVLGGTNTLAGLGKVTKRGTGNLTLDGVNFDAQEFEIAEGKVTLGMDAGLYSLGTDSGTGGGKVTILDGAQFNLNCTNTAGDNANIRLETTQLKTFVIAGAGPDGRGAIVNDSLDGRTTHNASWSSSFRRIELADDATIGGLDRFDVRGRSGTAATAMGGIFGPGKKLTIKNTGYFGLISLPLDVESVLVTEGGVFRPESATINAPGGITLDNGTLHGYSTTYPATAPLIVGAGSGALSAESGTTTFNGSVNVAEGATFTVKGGSTVNYNGGLLGGGQVRVENGTHNISGETTVGTFAIAGGNTYLANGFDAQSDITLTHTAGGFFMKEGSKAKKINVTLTGGSFGFMPGSGTGPQFDEINITSTGGAIDIRPQATGMMDVQGVINVNQTAGNTYVYGPGNNAEYGLALTMIGSIAQMNLGYTINNAGDLRLKEGSDLTVKNMHLSTNGSSGKGPAHGRIVIDPGAKVKVTGELHVGRWSQNPAVVSVHTVDVGGELDASGIVMFAGYDSPRTETYVRENAVLKVKGITTNDDDTESPDSWAYGNGVGATEGRHWVTLEGGRFEMGSSGFNGHRVPGVTKVDLQDGEFVNVNGAWGGAVGYPVFFGYDKLGGSVTFDLASYYVNWNQGLSGASDLTIKGAANFTRSRTDDDKMQGALLGKLTVENTEGNDLRATSAFAGGIKLADGVNAQVAKYSDERYPYAVAGYVIDQVTETAWSYPYASADFWTFANKNYGSNPIRRYTTIATRGEFYVPEDKAGQWTFAGNYDDWIRFDVDGAQVCKSASKCATARGTVELAAGWHKFTLAFEDCTGGSGANGTGWKDNSRSFGFVIGESSSDNGNDYTTFKPGASLGGDATLQMRPCVNACVWSWQNGNDNWATTENWSHIKCLDSVEYMHRHGNDGTDSTGYFNNKKVSRFQGWFKVEENQGGEWSFDMHYDDYKMLVIDGVTLINVGSWGDPTNAKITLTPGWHRWEARVGDNTGGYGPNNDKNKYWTLSYVAPDDSTEKQWIETNLKLAATLGDIAVLEPSGIYKDLELGAGSSLTSSGTMAMPIFGTLKGTGTLDGSFAFAGDSNSWEVNGKYNNRELACAKFAAPSRDTFLGLKKINAAFDAKPVCSAYFLTDAEVPSLVNTDLANVEVSVTGGEKDYSSKFSLGVFRGRLALMNRTPGGMVLYVR